MRRRVLESQYSLSSITGISVDIPTEMGVTHTLRLGDKDGTVFRGLTYSDFPFRFEPTPPNYFTSPYLLIDSESSYDPGSLHSKYIDIYYYCNDSSIFAGWELDYVYLDGTTVYEGDPDFPYFYTANVDGYYFFRITLPDGFGDYNTPINSCSMRIDLHIEDDILHGSYIQITL